MSRIVRFWVVAIGLLWSLALYAAGGLQLGGSSFGYAPAPPLSRGGGLGMGSHAFLASIGGVAFEQKARPTDGAAGTVELTYSPKLPDGSRLSVVLDGHRLSTSDFYDWELAPIAAYADTNQASLLTAFGSLTDKRAEFGVKVFGGYILNYHAGIRNTLLGLRIMQADMLLINPDAVDLPRLNGEYLLGAGEKPPDVATNTDALRAFRRNTDAIPENQQFQSYVLCDYQVDVTFGASGDALELTGEPRYVFWRPRKKAPDFNAATEVERMSEDLQAERDEARSKPGFSERAWLIDKIFYLLADFSATPPTPKEAAEQRRDFSEWPLESLNKQLRILVERVAPERTELMPSYAAAVMTPGLPGDLNPAVWSAVRHTMRFAALFRYVREQNPSGWKKFLARARQVRVQPSVRTPTTITPASAGFQPVVIPFSQ